MKRMEKKISKLEDRTIEITQSEQQRENGLGEKKKKKTTRTETGGLQQKS